MPGPNPGEEEKLKPADASWSSWGSSELTEKPRVPNEEGQDGNCSSGISQDKDLC